ncbi:MAG: hypothetical protein IKQ92_05735 [Clostridia bacterium]|nr:hypothetical protein [Clostridia bacterium]
MFRHELRKHLTRFNLLLAAVMLAVSLALVAADNAGTFKIRDEVNAAREKVFADYRADPDAVLKEKKDYENARQSALWGGEPVENVRIDTGGYTDANLWRDAEPVLDRVKSYRKDVKKVTSNALKKATDPDTVPGSYVYRYQLELISHYRPLEELEIPAEAQTGWNEYFALKAPAIFCFLTGIAVFSNIWLTEKRSRTTNVLRICKYGGRRLILTKLGVSAAFSVLLTLLFALTPLCVIAFTKGLGSTELPMQALKAFEFCPYPITVGQGLLFSVLAQVILFLLLDLGVVLLGQVLSNEIPVFGISLLVLVVSYVLSGAETSSRFYALRQFNFLDLATGEILLTRYRSLNIAGSLAGLIPTLCVLAALILAAFCALPFLVGTRAGEYKRLRLPTIRRRPKQEKSRLSDKPGSLSVARYEWTKNVVNARALILILAAAAVKLAVSGAYFEPYEGQYWEIYRSYMEELKGPVTEEKIAYIESERAYVWESYGEYDEAVGLYRDGKIEYEEFQEISERRNYANAVDHPLETVEKRLDYLTDPRRAEYKNLEFLDEQGIMRLFNQPLDFVLILLFIVLFSDVFVREYRTGFKSILHTLKYGGARTWLAKIGAVIGTGAFVWLVFLAVDLALVAKSWPLDFLSAGLMSIPDMEASGWGGSVFSYLCAFEAVRLLGAAALALGVVSLSAVTKKLVLQLAAAFALLVLPALIASEVTKGISIAALLAPSALPKTARLAGWVLFALLLAALSRRVWGKGGSR